ncbi:hypothetical protein D3C86_1477570 [compost metagenome]
MGRDQQVAGQRLHPVDRGAQRRRHVRVRRIGKCSVRHRIETRGENHVHTDLAFARLPRPTDAAGRVAGGEDRRHRRIAQTHGLPVVDPASIGNRRMFRNVRGLRIMSIDPPRAQGGGADGAGDHLRPAVARQRGQTARMVIMRLGVQDVADVLDPETQLTNVRLRRRHGLGQGAVDQD